MVTNQNQRIGLRLDPLDVLFLRDGRPFDAAARLKGGLPNPQTLAGALRTALLTRRGFDFTKFRLKRSSGGEVREALIASQADEWIVNAHFRGPWLAIAKDGVIEPLLAQPETIIPVKGAPKKSQWLRREPLPTGTLPGWDDPELPLPLWTKGEPDEKADPYLFTLKGIRQFLNGKNEFEPADLFEVSELYDFDNRTGIGIDMETLTSGDGNIYGVRLLSLKPQVFLYAEVIPGSGAPEPGTWFSENDSIPFGGEGRYARVEVCQSSTLPAWPRPEPSRKDALWYLASPAFFGPGPRPLPTVVSPGRLMAAASGVGIPVSGWDVARNGPRPTRFAVPSGAVYFVEGEFSPVHQSLSPDSEHVAEGWGFALQGVWKRGASA